jgi:hypothetical protein
LRECEIEAVVAFISALVKVQIENFSIILFGEGVRLIKTPAQEWDSRCKHLLISSLFSPFQNATLDVDAGHLFCS